MSSSGISWSPVRSLCAAQFLHPRECHGSRVRAAVAPQTPIRVGLVNLRAREALVVAVVPLAEVVPDLSPIADTGQSDMSRPRSATLKSRVSVAVVVAANANSSVSSVWSMTCTVARPTPGVVPKGVERRHQGTRRRLQGSA